MRIAPSLAVAIELQVGAGSRHCLATSPAFSVTTMRRHLPSLLQPGGHPSFTPPDFGCLSAKLIVSKRPGLSDPAPVSAHRATARVPREFPGPPGARTSQRAVGLLREAAAPWATVSRERRNHPGPRRARSNEKTNEPHGYHPCNRQGVHKVRFKDRQ